MKKLVACLQRKVFCNLKKILLVYNPVSGRGVFKKKLDSVIENFQRRKILTAIYRTEKDNSGADFLDCVKNFGAEGIISAGGDGTLHRVVNWIKIFDLNLPVGIFGAGTSNDFATHLEITDSEKYFDAIAAGKIKSVDLGKVGSEFFINVASAGAFTSIAHEVDSKQKNALGKFAYYLRGIGELKNFKSAKLEVTADNKNFKIDAFLFLVLNSPAVASLKKISAVAKIDDGKLDFLALKKCSPRQLLQLSKKILSGESVHDEENIFYLQAKNFEIKSAEVLTSDLDGEVGDNLPLKIETVPQAINFFVP